MWLTFRFQGLLELPGCPGCLWVPLGCLLGASWVLPGFPLFCDVSWVASPGEHPPFDVFCTSLLMSFWCQRHLSASISKDLWSNSVDIMSKCGKVETTILPERGVDNQALEGLWVVLFCHLFAHVLMPCFFYDLFVKFVACVLFVCPFRVHFWQDFAIMLTCFSWLQKMQKVQIPGAIPLTPPRTHHRRGGNQRHPGQPGGSKRPWKQNVSYLSTRMQKFY